MSSSRLPRFEEISATRFSSELNILGLPPVADRIEWTDAACDWGRRKWSNDWPDDDHCLCLSVALINIQESNYADTIILREIYFLFDNL